MLFVVAALNIKRIMAKTEPEMLLYQRGSELRAG
jgi:hypothetical protein